MENRESTKVYIIQGEKSRKDTASSGKLVSIFET